MTAHPRDPERGWHRDQGGRLYRDEAGARFYRSEADRDAALEDSYTGRPCETSCCRSMLASVARHANEERGLVEQYMQWARNRHAAEVHDSETLAQWERERFGSRLYVAAHCVLLYAVMVARFGEPHRKAKQERLGVDLADQREA